MCSLLLVHIFLVAHTLPRLIVDLGASATKHIVKEWAGYVDYRNIQMAVIS